MARREKRVSFGPSTIPHYSYNNFTPIRGVNLQDVWRLVGPTVERNIEQPLWAQFAAVYLEGLNHGSGAERDRLRASGELPIPWLP